MILDCKYCKATKKSIYSLRSHERLCKSNPDRSVSFFEDNKSFKRDTNTGKVCVNKDGKNRYVLPGVVGEMISLGWVEGVFLKEKRVTVNNGDVIKSIPRKSLEGFLAEGWVVGNGTAKTKTKISASMKLAHRDGRAWNIGKSRWNNEKSWPEKFFTSVIENEFENKNYFSEHPVGIYSIDFAWVDEKKAIEIDGEQHEKPDYKERDKRKDLFLEEKGWKILRIKWKDFCNDTKSHIRAAKHFIEEV